MIEHSCCGSERHLNAPFLRVNLATSFVDEWVQLDLVTLAGGAHASTRVNEASKRRHQ